MNDGWEAGNTAFKNGSTFPHPFDEFSFENSACAICKISSSFVCPLRGKSFACYFSAIVEGSPIHCKN